MRFASFSRPAGTAAAVGLVLSAMFACGGSSDDEEDDNNFREDVIQCEEALARLERCCPDFDPLPVLCNYYYSKSSGCGTTTEQSVAPALSESESRCVRDLDCEELVDKGVCERAQKARAYTSEITTSNDGGTSRNVQKHASVCP